MIRINDPISIVQVYFSIPFSFIFPKARRSFIYRNGLLCTPNSYRCPYSYQGDPGETHAYIDEGY